MAAVPVPGDQGQFVRGGEQEWYGMGIAKFPGVYCVDHGNCSLDGDRRLKTSEIVP